MNWESLRSYITWKIRSWQRRLLWRNPFQNSVL